MLIDGAAYAEELRSSLLDELPGLPDGAGIATLLVGEDLAAQVYQRRIDRHAQELGVYSRPELLPGDATLGQVVGKIAELDADPQVSGILVLRPLPAHLEEARVFSVLPVLKDVEAQHPVNAGLLSLGMPRFVPSTPAAAFHMLDRYTASVGRDPEIAYDGLGPGARRPLQQRRQAGRDPRPAAQRDRDLLPSPHVRRGAAVRAHAGGRHPDRRGRGARAGHRRDGARGGDRDRHRDQRPAQRRRLGAAGRRRRHRLGRADRRGGLAGSGWRRADHRHVAAAQHDRRRLAAGRHGAVRAPPSRADG